MIEVLKLVEDFIEEFHQNIELVNLLVIFGSLITKYLVLKPTNPYQNNLERLIILRDLIALLDKNLPVTLVNLSLFPSLILFITLLPNFLSIPITYHLSLDHYRKIKGRNRKEISEVRIRERGQGSKRLKHAGRK